MMDTPIGQLLFDPAGEYANFNLQDQTALRLLGKDWVSIYQFGATGTDPAIKPLQVNFFDEAQRPLTRTIIEMVLAGEKAGYIDNFRAIELGDPERGEFPDGTDGENEFRRTMVHRGRTRVAFYALLAKAGYSVPQNWAGIRFSIKGDLADRCLAAAANCLTKGTGSAAGTATVRTGAGLTAFMDWVVGNWTNVDVADFGKDEQFKAVKAVYDKSGGSVAFNRLAANRQFHNPVAARDYCDEIYDELSLGKIVIVDLSRGDESAIQVLSERIVNRLIERASSRFAHGDAPKKMQVFVEEAHRLFDRAEFAKREKDPWVRLAKEAAKYEIGLVYATQEVSSVEERVLANTHNWVVAHLNSKREIRELSNYYDFASFADDILRSEDRGHARIKTLSGKFIVPVQIERFDHSLINQARASAGLAPVTIDAGGKVIIPEDG